MLKANLEKYIDGRISNLRVEDQENMLMQIGNADSYLRDELIYPALTGSKIPTSIHHENKKNKCGQLPVKARMVKLIIIWG